MKKGQQKEWESARDTEKYSWVGLENEQVPVTVWVQGQLRPRTGEKVSEREWDRDR